MERVENETWREGREKHISPLKKEIKIFQTFYDISLYIL